MSTILDYANHELQILGADAESQKYKCLVAFANCCDENTNEAALLRTHMYRLQNKLPLSDLTGAAEEWETVDGIVRNKRCHRVVKEGESCYDTEAIVFYTVAENGEPIKSITEDSKVLIEFPYHVKTIYQQVGV